MRNGAEDEGGDTPTLLIVGDLHHWRLAGRDLPDLDGFHFVDFADVTGDLLDRLRPDVVLSALMAEGFDALDLAATLAALSYRGAYRSIGVDLPNPAAIRREVMAAAPGLDFEILLISPERPH